MRKSTAIGTGDAFGAAFKGSRLVSLARPIKSNTSASVTGSTPSAKMTRKQQHQQSQRHPTHQVLTTTPASHFRRDWGLKRPMPANNRARFITLEQMDTESGITAFESGAKYALIKKRIEELRQPVKPILSRAGRDDSGGGRTTRGDQLFMPLAQGSEERSNQLQNQRKIKVAEENPTVDQFRKYLDSTGLPTKTIESLLQNKSDLHAALQKYVIHSSWGSTNHPPPPPPPQHDHRRRPPQPPASPIATAGLLYTLPGSLSTRPPRASTTRPPPSSPLFAKTAGLTTQLHEGSAVPGRLVHASGTAANVAGITSTCNLANVDLVELQNRPLVYDVVQGFTVQSLSVTRQGSVDLVVRAVGAGGGQRRKGALLSSRAKQGAGEFMGLVAESIA